MPADLQHLALQAAGKSHSPYSQFPVGAALVTTDGRVFAGTNVENVSSPEGWCAETSAIAHMVMDGGGKIAEIAVLGLKADLCTPCGGCRQRIAEFGSQETKVHLCNKDGVVETVTLGDLLPKSFVI
ncbi:MAG: cytidine deaminase [Salaquimonas sp.]